MKYLKVSYFITFEENPEWGRPPAFVLRSVLGLSLKRLTCALKLQEQCRECILFDSCIYSVFFESNIEKNSISLQGRDKAVHPFVLDILSLKESKAEIQITFIGKATNYIPYINIALENAGKLGVGKKRTKFVVDSILSNGKSFFQNTREIAKSCDTWFPTEIPIKTPKKIILETPCRIKEQGRYISTIDLNSLVKNMERRIKALSEIFCDEVYSLNLSNLTFDSDPVNQRWIEKVYYSSRQHTTMKLGGVVGEIIIIKEKLPIEVTNLIGAMELFHVGKNISFGLGRIKVEYDECR